MNNDSTSPSVGAGQKENDDVARKYRKVDPAKWDDEWYVAQDDAMRNLWDLLLTGPQVRVVPGLQLCGPASLAELLRRPFETVSKLFQKLIADGKIQYDERFRLVRLPNAPKYNAPENLNQLKGWFNSWLELPESRLKYEHIPTLATTLRGADSTLVNEFRKGFETVWQEFRTQEQEQEQEQDHHGEPSVATTNVFDSKVDTKAPLDLTSSLMDSANSQTATDGGDNAGHEQGGKTKAKAEQRKAKTQPQRQLTIAGTESGQDATNGSKPGENALEVLRGQGWALWRDAWRERYGAKYVNSPQDGKAMEVLLKSALEAAKERSLDDAGECLKHWFKSFLDDKGYNNRIAEERHPLSWLPKSLNKFGLPWSRPTENSSSQQYQEIRLPVGGGASSLATQAKEQAPELKALLSGGFGLQLGGAQ